MERQTTGVPNFKRVLVTGITGAGASEILGKLPGKLNEKRTVTLKHYNIGNGIINGVIPDYRMKLTDQNILKTIPDLQASLHATALYSKLDEIKNEGGIHLIDMHATFLTTMGLVEGLSYHDIELVDPDLFITIIDGPQDIHSHLKEHPGEYFDLTVADIIKWQEFEVYITNLFAKIRDKLHLVVPRKEASQILEKILLHYQPPGNRSKDYSVPVYVSYPMTLLPEDEKWKRDEFIKTLKDRPEFIVFDPGSVESSHRMEEYYTPDDRRAIGAHTIMRDLNWFIRINSEKVIAYMALIESGDNKAPTIVPSSGSNDELRCAYEAGLDTYIVMGRQAGQHLPPISPFAAYKAKMFVSCEEFFYYLDLSRSEQAAYDIMAREMAARISADEGPEQENEEKFCEACRNRCRYHLSKQAYEAVQERLKQMVKTLCREWEQPPSLAKLQWPLPIEEANNVQVIWFQ